MSGQPWTEAKRTELAELVSRGLKVKEVAVAMGRTYGSIRAAMLSYKLRSRSRAPEVITSPNNIIDRIEAETIRIPECGCWVWTGCLFNHGYGSIRVNNKTRRVHRVAYEVLRGRVPEGMHLDHKCCVKSCWNPNHLDVVTPQENSQRYTRTITHCPAGHPYDEENTYLTPSNRRVCRKCRAAVSALSRKRKAAAAQFRAQQL